MVRLHELSDSRPDEGCVPNHNLGLWRLSRLGVPRYSRIVCGTLRPRGHLQGSQVEISAWGCFIGILLGTLVNTSTASR